MRECLVVVSVCIGEGNCMVLVVCVHGACVVYCDCCYGVCGEMLLCVHVRDVRCGMVLHNTPTNINTPKKQYPTYLYRELYCLPLGCTLRAFVSQAK